MKNLLKHILIISLLISCRSEVKISTIEASAPSGAYSFNDPSTFSATSADSFTLSMSSQDGFNEIESQFLKLVTTGSADCDYDLDDIYSTNPTITLSNCTGNGRVQFEYGSQKSLEVLINNSSGTLLSNSWDIYIMKDGVNALIIDSDRLFQVNLETGVRTIIHSNSVGSGGADIGGMTSMQVNDAEDTVYAVDASNNTVVKIDIPTGHGEVVSSPTIGTGQNLLNPTRLLVTANESTAYLADRNTHTFIVVDISTGDRAELAPYVGICYGMTFGQDEDSFYLVQHMDS